MKKKFIYTIIILSIIGCSSDSGNNTPPIASGYIEPLNNETCAGEDISEDLIEVNFRWSPFEDNENNILEYTLTIFDQMTNDVFKMEKTNTTNFKMTLVKGNRYYWNVSAIDSSGEMVLGSTWQFQTPINTVNNYLPFPARILTPSNGLTLNTRSIVLRWKGNDPDTGETETLIYDLYLSQNNPPVIFEKGLTTPSYSRTFTSGIYYWKITSIDVNNNKSDSQINQFIIK